MVGLAMGDATGGGGAAAVTAPFVTLTIEFFVSECFCNVVRFAPPPLAPVTFECIDATSVMVPPSSLSNVLILTTVPNVRVSPRRSRAAEERPAAGDEPWRTRAEENGAGAGEGGEVAAKTTLREAGRGPT